ncbi:NTP transferase domain-containing protein [Polymorphobacter fuscus]|uniref:NTP transferase domain-containing protein n=1 Tax=Sandarakinorhabdus fusca TaxID=1439888 RepID=A0A7C9GT47_9SPHN|nr:NTP transferase domain-containing protein [Polymorphobacter fuscus]KAB7648412.1 NTP transferase domain-containing protein [Polymorphobacter fuscus]MQT15929.1 NTP transferase domain-containing protein [Polymorphobacter fuscus]NJC07795.1 1L-myo-inositol 1-phosphate cytidylyltransferase [Polymorphobacter fuscus]
MQAIILAAGMGTRLRAVSPSKPLTMVAGRPLLAHILANLRAAGVTRPLVITGYRGDEVAAVASAFGAETLHNPHWDQPNGVSVLAAAPQLAETALLLMADHLASPGLYRTVATAGRPDAGLVLGIDRRLGHPWADEADVTRVATRAGRIIAIGKHLNSYDAHDCGVFLVTPELTDALAGLPTPGLSDGVRVLAARGRAATVDVSAHDWIDIDDPRALGLAEAWVARGS